MYKFNGLILKNESENHQLQCLYTFSSTANRRMPIYIYIYIYIYPILKQIAQRVRHHYVHTFLLHRLFFAWTGCQDSLPRSLSRSQEFIIYI